MTRTPSAAWMTLALLVMATFPLAVAPAHTVHRAPDTAVPVRYREGMVHGFLELSTEPGALLAHGDWLQTPKDSVIHAQMVFHLAEGSVFDEKVSFTQRGVFTMQSYHLVQSGPAFAEDLDATLERSGRYMVKTKSHKDGKEHEYAGTLDLPPDTYNGMVITIAKNISTREATSIHFVAFMPEPRVVTLDIEPDGTDRVTFGKHEEPVVKFAVKPKIGTMLRLGAKLTGKDIPPDSHVWIVTDDVPAFVKSVGPLYSGPVWQVLLTSPEWRK